MSNHTPGPWSALDTEWGAKVVDEQEVTVADVPQQPMDTWEAMATARLIAAAPDLLEIVEAALAWCEQDAENEDGYPTQEMMDNRVAVLRAAIEAVQGGEE